jgi:hypothetical protein
MATRFGRRALLKGLAGGAALLAARPARAAVPDLRTLASALRRLPADAALDHAARALAAGAAREDVLGAVFLAGVEDIRPLPVGHVLHTVMMVESVCVLAEGADATTSALAALWALDDFKNGQAQDERRGDWQLGPAPRPLSRPEVELRRALERFDPDQAERAIVGLAAEAGTARCFEALWPFAARSLRDAGHRIIHAAQLDRAVRRFGVDCALPALRSVTIGLATDAEGDHTAAWTRARELAARLPTGWRDGRASTDASLDLLRSLRGRTPFESQDLVLDAYRSGLGPQSVWDGLRLYAAELMLLRPARRSVFPVHTLTEMEALGHVFARANDEATLRLVALQAGAWLATVRDAVVRNNGAYDAGPGIDGPIERMPAGRIAEAIDSRLPVRARAALAGDPAATATYVRRLRDDLVPRADQNHQYKLVAAVIEESRRVDPRLRAQVLSTALDYVPAASEPVTDVHRRSRSALERAGSGH